MAFPLKPEAALSFPRTLPISVPATFTPSLDSSNIGRPASQLPPTSLSSVYTPPQCQIMRPSPSHFSNQPVLGTPAAAVTSTPINPFLAPTSAPSLTTNPIQCSTPVPSLPSTIIPPTQHSQPSFSSGFTIPISSHLPSLPFHSIANSFINTNPNYSSAIVDSRNPELPQNSVQTMMNTLFISSGNHQFEDPEAWRYKKAEEMPMYFMETFCKIQKECDNNEAVIAEAQRSVKVLERTSEHVVVKCKQLTNFLQKISAVQKRVEIALDSKQNYERNIMKYLKELIKLSERAHITDMYSPVVSPAGFVPAFLELCEKRLVDIEKQVISIEEMFRTESNLRNLKLLVSTAALMHEKFTVISALTLEVHKRIENLFNAFQGQIKNHSLSGISENSFMIDHCTLKPTSSPYSSIKAIISGKSINNSNIY